jgi:hypothetical protein
MASVAAEPSPLYDRFCAALGNVGGAHDELDRAQTQGDETELQRAQRLYDRAYAEYLDAREAYFEELEERLTDPEEDAPRPSPGRPSA